MTRICLLAAVLAVLATPALAECETGGLFDTCDDGTSPRGGTEEEYQRLDGGGFGGRPAEAKAGKTITVGDTTVTLAQTEEEADQPWQPFNREFGDYDSLAREDSPKDPADPLTTRCHADGCY